MSALGATGLRRVRDLLIIDEKLVLATDSIGGIGPKPADTVKTDAATVGHFALRVPLLEVLCAGAAPMLVINDLCVEQDPTGELIIAEIRRLAATVDIPPEAVTGSTEENVPTVATGIGVTVLGRLPAGVTARPGGSQPDDVVLCAGLPLSAPRDLLYPGHPGQVSVAAVIAVMRSGLVHDALPVGSRGLRWEVPQLAHSAGLDLDWRESAVSRDDSGGPSSCVLFSLSLAAVPAVSQLLDGAPVNLVASLRPKGPSREG